MTKNIFILGRQPELGIAELESLLSSDKINLFSPNIAISDQPLVDKLETRLGGTQKVAEVLFELSLMGWPDIEQFIRDNAVHLITENVNGKLKLGISAYGLNVNPRQLNASNLALKKIIKARGHSVRIVPNTTADLSTAQVLHNHLTLENGFELIIAASNKDLVIARTKFVQDINGYSNRDQNRPMRDAKVGMLPPKLAQIMINIANPAPNSLLLDPFCGTGVVLQEALLMGFNAYGTDVDKRMVEYSDSNLKWLSRGYDGLPEWQVEEGNATTYQWKSSPGSIVAETYLGKPLSRLPLKKDLELQASYVNDLIERFLINLGQQIESGTRLCIAVPAWVMNNGFYHLALLDHLEKIGYNHISFKSVDTNKLIYYRPEQIVARQLLLLSRK